MELSRIALPPAEQPAKATLIEPAGSGYLFLAAEVDAHPPFLWTSPAKQRLIEDIGRWCRRIAREAGVREAVVFKAILVPPIGEAGFLRRRPQQYHRARFDLALLIETDTVARAEALRVDAQFRVLEAHVRDEAGHV